MKSIYLTPESDTFVFSFSQALLDGSPQGSLSDDMIVNPIIDEGSF